VNCYEVEVIDQTLWGFRRTRAVESRGFHAAHARVPWLAMTDVRTILIHPYDRVAAEILVGIVR
jgi:uncharacterized protein with HEPN domain